jgi:electron transfer flavoprotein alpha subunit
VLLGHGVEDLAADLRADRVLYLNDPALTDFNPESYGRALEGVLSDDPPRAVLFGDTSMGAGVAGGLSGRLQWPLVSRCREIDASTGEPKFVSQICGGKILVEGMLPAPTTLVTMVPGAYQLDAGRSTEPPAITPVPVPSLGDGRIVFKGYIEPEAGDVDITSESVLIAVGRGITHEENIELAEELATALGGVVCASRPVVDQGWLPISRMVGKSGKRVKPTVYLAFGISGAPEHVEGMSDSDVIIAINTDPAAPIFDVAQYGSEVDVLDLLPVLIERVSGG